MDLNIRLIKTVEANPLLYKEQATIEDRQKVWQQISNELGVPESVLKSRWHIICGYYQRCLEKRRSTDAEDNDNEGTNPNDFRYESAMAFMMPYMHARIAIAAANAARKQQELETAGNKELIDPEFIITEKDIENATSICCSGTDDFMIYEVEKLDGEAENIHMQQYQHHLNETSTSYEDGEDEESHEEHLQIMQTIDEDIGEVIEEVDDSQNFVVQDLIIEGGSELLNEYNEQIVVEDEEIMQMEDQIDLQTETVVEEVVEDDSNIENLHESSQSSSSPTPFAQVSNHAVIIQGPEAHRILRIPPNIDGQNFVKIRSMATSTSPKLSVPKQEMKVQQEEEQKKPTERATPSFAPEYNLMTRRRRAVVLKATPRVQVELTDNAVANAQFHEETVGPMVDLPEHGDIMARQDIKERLGNMSRCSHNDFDNRSNDSNVVTTTAAESEEEFTPKGERSEDTIFGELVTAMLKHMPQERKRAIKKSIMDLLLT